MKNYRLLPQEPDSVEILNESSSSAGAVHHQDEISRRISEEESESIPWLEQEQPILFLTSWHRWRNLIYGDHLKSVLLAMFLLITGVIFLLMTLIAAYKRNLSETIVFLMISLLTLPPGIYEGWIILHIIMGYSGYRLELSS